MTESHIPDTSRLGAQLTARGCHFGLWAPRAERVELALINGLGEEQTNHEMVREHDGVWTIEVPGVKAKQRYGFRVHGPWDPSSGTRFNPAKLLVDPYAKAITGGVDYHGPILDHIPQSNFEPDKTDSFGAVPLSVVVPPGPAPTPIKQRRPLTECSIYEMHLRGFTHLHPLVPEHLRGTYLGLAYPAVIEHLVETGINTVELLPIHHFVSEPFTIGRGLSNYWGYNTLGFFAPHAFYATVSTLGEQVREFKEMVSALHEAGIEVLLDVVYNHTAEGGHEGPTLHFRGIDHEAYYRLTNDRRNDYDVTGCGNSVDTSNPWVLEMVLDSMRYWVQEMGVDGFRFDLATTLIRDEAHHVRQDHAFKQRVAADPVLADIKMIAEPWDMGPYGYQVGDWGPGWSEWNDRYRNYIRDYWRGATHGVQELASRLSGSPDIFDRPGRNLSACINFVTAHDGFTMRDLVTYDVKHNEANGEYNRDGSDDNRSHNYGWEGETDNEDINRLRHRQVRNMMATLLLSTGVPMFAAGDEMGRTQSGNNNAYCQDSPLSWVHWDTRENWSDVHEMVKTLLKLRAEHPILRPSEYRYHSELKDATGAGLGRVDLTWMDGFDGEMGEDDWHDGGRRLLGMYVSDVEKAFLTWYNSSTNNIEITLPRQPWGKNYRVIVHTCDEDEIDGEWHTAGSKFWLPARSVVLMEVEVANNAIQLAQDIKQAEAERALEDAEQALAEARRQKEKAEEVLAQAQADAQAAEAAYQAAQAHAATITKEQAEP